MLSNYFTLLHIANELHRRYARTVIAQVYSQEKNTLSIVVYAPEPHTISINCTARENYILARSGDIRKHHNSIDLFPSLIDKHIESVFISATDRIINFKISENLFLCLEMFASKANIVLCDERGTILDAFLNKRELIGTEREIQRSEKEISVDDILPSINDFSPEIFGSEDRLKILKKLVPKLGTRLAEEVIFKFAAMDSRLTGNNINSLHSLTTDIIQKLLISDKISPVIYFEEKSPVCFSLLALEHMSSYKSETYEDLFVAIQKFISFERSTSTYLQKKKEIVSWITKELEKAQRTIRAVESELAESSRAEQYELHANLLMTNLPSITKGMKSIQLQNSFSQNEETTIKLDGTISPQKNVEKLYEKAKKAKSARKESAERLETLKKRELSLKDLLEKSNGISESVSLKNFLQSYGGMVKELGFMTDKEQEELPPFKIFTVEGGFTVYCGKNSANNDLLTFRFAKPNDLWFHSRGSSGSHVVLKIGSAQGTPTKKAIEQAAAIAAYYSKMKNAKHVPVAMTERKYIRKPKGAPPGTVAIEKEKVIFVQPVLPEIEK